MNQMQQRAPVAPQDPRTDQSRPASCARPPHCWGFELCLTWASLYRRYARTEPTKAPQLVYERIAVDRQRVRCGQSRVKQWDWWIRLFAARRGRWKVRPHFDFQHDTDEPVFAYSDTKVCTSYGDSHPASISTDRTGPSQPSSAGDLPPATQSLTYNSTCPLDLLGSLCCGLPSHFNAGRLRGFFQADG